MKIYSTLNDAQSSHLLPVSQLFAMFLCLVVLSLWPFPADARLDVYPNCQEAKATYNADHINDVMPTGTGTNIIVYDCPGAESTTWSTGQRTGYCFGIIKDMLVQSTQSPAEVCYHKTQTADRVVYGTYGEVPDKLKNAGSACGGVGNPIQPGTGNKFQQEVDYVGAGSFPLTLSRSYIVVSH